MESLVSVVLTLAYIVAVAVLVIKKYNSVLVFLGSGILVLLAIFAFKDASLLGDKATGNFVFDVFTFVTQAFSSNTAGVGMTLMMVTGYAVYMSHIGASTKLATIASKPLSKIRNPYIALSFVFIIGILLKLVITSHAGLAMLLMAVSFPILTSLGISKLSSAVVIVLCGFLDWGPNDSAAIFAAEKVSGMQMVDYFFGYQAKVAFALIAICAIVLPIYCRWIDKKQLSNEDTKAEIDSLEQKDCPTLYAILPLVPLLLIIIVSFIPGQTLSVPAANFLGLMFVFGLELIRRAEKKLVSNDFKVVLEAMATSFKSVVAILIGAAVFAEAIKQLGGITIISNTLAHIQTAPIIVVALMALITFLAGVVMGSGNASWYAFGPLVPDMAAHMGTHATTIAVPMQLSASIGRSMSPVAGVIIAVAGMTQIDIMDLVKRIAPIAILLYFSNILVSYVIV